ncbi:cytochrome C biogenesis protein [Stenotrophomonas pictorum JCM 9942]|uniref:Cytochrome C biogenesis protein n=1 Tax=Stenotrophomonas pictorum JCM 9942 TaxID=1236960 RepID=A0A0R0ADR4_9GAMM|nr:cytochrome c biogenesis protein DipZ [Stenotrophomonas pictorum]KRG42879.1 cytochrome C biogenesis protein [Stenotrophomonas pictorum JCM 9942]
MVFLLIAYLGGVLTILSPCILPVLPFVFARADRPFRRNGLPLLIGMGVTFALVASLATVGGAWAVRANQYGRWIALAVLALLGLTLLSERVAEWVSRPFVRMGQRLSQRADAGGDSIWAALGLGVATGLLWVPCAGPILGLLLTAAAINGASVATALLLLVYAAGAATSLALALLIGGRVFAAMKRTLGAGQWLRRALGVLVLAGVAAIALGLDTGLLTRVSLASNGPLEQKLLDTLKPPPGGPAVAQPASESEVLLADLGPMPPLAGATLWLNSPPLDNAALRGKVVLVDFWTYSCINCLRALPYVRAWSDKYAAQGLVVVGVHAPEFAFEKDPGNVRRAVRELGIGYPVALDNDYAIWRAFNNQYWPAHYFIDANGRVRYRHFGEGNYARSEAVIRQLLREAGDAALPAAGTAPRAAGAQAAPSTGLRQSPETYIGYERAANFAGGRLVYDDGWDYRAPSQLRPDQWALDGRWNVQRQFARNEAAGARVLYRFRGRDLHLVLGPAGGGKPLRFRIRLDGQAPGADHGVDTDADGQGVVTEHRLYQLVRQQAGGGERLFEIEFLDPGMKVYAFTFG